MAAVLLLHGHGRTGTSMLSIATALRAQGHATLAPSYGFWRAMPAILAYLAPRVANFAESQPGPVHIVTHSLGGLVARAFLAAHRPPDLGRVVMLAPPNSGSELADLLHAKGLDTRILGPIAPHLRTRRAPELEAMFAPVDYPLGIVAGSRCYTPVPSTLLPRPHDGKVSVAATRLPGMADHIVLPVTHSMMTLDRTVLAQTLVFLETGSFAR